MGAVNAVIRNGAQCPVTSIFILLICWVWVKVFVAEWESNWFSVTYNELVVRKQWWRIFSVHIAHVSFLHLLLNTTTLWNCRWVEKINGSMFMLKYTLLLMVVEAVFTGLMIKLAITVSPFRTVLSQVLTNLTSFGCSGLALAWVAYMSVAFSGDKDPQNPDYGSTFVLLGIVPFHMNFGPLVLIAAYYLLLPRNNMHSNLSGLLCGYSLASGLLDILRESYWSICFVLNCVLMIILSTSADFRYAQSALVPARLTLADRRAENVEAAAGSRNARSVRGEEGGGGADSDDDSSTDGGGASGVGLSGAIRNEGSSLAFSFLDNFPHSRDASDGGSTLRVLRIGHLSSQAQRDSDVESGLHSVVGEELHDSTMRESSGTEVLSDENEDLAQRSALTSPLRSLVNRSTSRDRETNRWQDENPANDMLSDVSLV